MTQRRFWVEMGLLAVGLGLLWTFLVSRGSVSPPGAGQAGEFSIQGVRLGMARSDLEKTWGKPAAPTLQEEAARPITPATPVARAPREARPKRSLTVDDEGWVPYRCGSRVVRIQYGVAESAGSPVERVEAIQGEALENDGQPVNEQDLIALGLRRNTTEELPSARAQWQRRSTTLHVYSPWPRPLDASTQELRMISIDTTETPPRYILERTLVNGGRPSPSKP